MVEYEHLVNHLRDTFSTGILDSHDKRKHQLQAFHRLLTDNHERLCEAMSHDLHKPKIESIAHEIEAVVAEINEALTNLKTWMAPAKVTRYILQMTDSAYLHKDPLGVVLIIGAWNFPVRLLLAPLVGAIAAGNTVILKPSELAAHTAKVIADLVPKYMSEDVVRVVQGGPREASELLKLRFDHIFFTGSPTIGKIIMKAAAEHLTPVTLELGGKNPVIVDDDVDLITVGRRIAWGKFMNAGQICITGDYILNVNRDREALIRSIVSAIREFYGENERDSEDYVRIINEHHYDRLMGLLQNTKGKIVYGGDSDRDLKYIQPTIVSDVKMDDALMKEEIFGPILPIIDIGSVDQAIEFINKREKPLTLYLFSDHRHNVDNVLKKTSSGNVTINDLIMHVSLDTLPFGGVGNSGMGRYHGKYTFDTFTHEKAVLHRTSGFEKLLFMRYPPYNDAKLAWARRVLAKWRMPF